MSKLKQVKDFAKKHQRHIERGLDFSHRCLSSFLETQESNILNRKNQTLAWAQFAYSMRSNYISVYKDIETDDYFNGPEWKLLGASKLSQLIINVVISHLAQRANKINGKPGDIWTAYTGEVDGVLFGWLLWEGKPEKIFVSSREAEKAPSIIQNLLWKEHSNHISVSLDDDDHVYLDSDSNAPTLDSELAQTTVKSLKKYLEKNFSRSLMFYGPPGSGKSNLVRHICNQLNFRTLRLPQMGRFTLDILLHTLNFLNPDALIIEDVDNLNVEDLADFLGKIERLNSYVRIVLGTSNQISRLDNALIRPGRFDQALEVCCLDPAIIQSITQDEEITQMVLGWPAASIQELMKRVLVEGKDEAIRGAGDLIDRLEMIDQQNYTLSDMSVDPYFEPNSDPEPTEK